MATKVQLSKALFETTEAYMRARGQDPTLGEIADTMAETLEQVKADEKEGK